MKSKDHNRARAFTRLELAALLGGLALLALVTLPMTAGPATRADRIACVNNLRQIGQAFNIWASEHQDTFPWKLAYKPDNPNNMGTQGHVLHEQLWFQYFCLSNELKTPVILSCPADQRTGKKTATRWDKNPQGGLLSSSYGANAISYILNLHVDPLCPKLALVLDRDILPNTRSACSYYFSSVAGIYAPHPNLRWTNGVHKMNMGNVVLFDGQVVQADDAGLRESFPGERLNVIHLLTPF